MVLLVDSSLLISLYMIVTLEAFIGSSFHVNLSHDCYIYNKERARINPMNPDI